MQSKIIQIIPAPPNMWARWEPDDGEEVEFSPIICLALMESGNGSTYVSPMVCFADDGLIEEATDFRNFGGIVFSKDPIAENKPLWHDAKADPPKIPGLYYGKKDDTNSMWLCRYRDGKWVMDDYPEQEMKIIQWAEYTAFTEV